MSSRGGPVIGVVGGSGGIGASTLAAVLALRAGGVLIDLVCVGGGIDVLLDIERTPGARWSGLDLAGGRLSSQVLLDGLPHVRGCAVLAADVVAVDPDAVRQVIDAASRVRPVVLDLPRTVCAERTAAVACCDLVVVLARADVAGLVAAHAVVATLPDVPLGVVVRGGAVPADEAAGLVGAPMVGRLPGGTRPVDPARPPCTLTRVAHGVLAGVAGSSRRPRDRPVVPPRLVAVAS